MAFEAQGAIFFWSSNTAASTSTGNAVGNIVDFNGPGGQANVIDVTHLGSTAREKLIGLRDEGQVSMTMLMTFSTSDAQERLRNDRASRAIRKCVIQFNDSTVELNKGKAIFDASVLGYSVTGAVNDAVRANVVLEVLNAVTWTTSSSI